MCYRFAKAHLLIDLSIESDVWGIDILEPAARIQYLETLKMLAVCYASITLWQYTM